MHEIKMVAKEDLPELKSVLDSIDLFPSEMLDDMISDYFSNPESEEMWFTTLENMKPVAIGYCAPEKLTEGTYNLYAIGVKSNLQGKGLGSKMMGFVENKLKDRGARVLIVDTSGSDDFALTRKFYEKLDYSKEAVIRDFWDEGDDKVVYWKRID